MQICFGLYRNKNFIKDIKNSCFLIEKYFFLFDYNLYNGNFIYDESILDFLVLNINKFSYILNYSNNLPLFGIYICLFISSNQTRMERYKKIDYLIYI